VLFEKGQNLLFLRQRVNNLKGIRKRKSGYERSRYLINENIVPQDICQINSMSKEMRVVVCEE
jgi:ribosomal protein S6E (S10)